MNQNFTAVYGPVASWRYGRSLGIDPIGPVSTCSFNCIYCQLGEIEHLSGDRQIFIPTTQILKELEYFAPWQVDVITLSGSGEPTLALNLGEIIQGIKKLTGKPVLVLTNATLLNNPEVRQELALADKVSVKLDGLWQEQLQKINRPIPNINLENILTGIEAFQKQFQGELSVQTMVIQAWDNFGEERYFQLLKTINPQEVHLNAPTRPKPQQRELEGRSNQTREVYGDRPVTQIKCVDRQVLQGLADRLQYQTGIPIRCAPAPI